MVYIKLIPFPNGSRILCSLVMNGLVVPLLVVGLAAKAFAFLPESIAEVSNEDVIPEVTFTLYTREHGNKGMEIVLGDKESIKKAGFNGKLPVMVATHGYLASASGESVQGLTKGFLGRGDVNFIAVDWSKYSKNILYEQAALAVKAVGLHVSRFLLFLSSETGFKIKDAHFMGHSLGAHIASFASDAFPGEKIGRITGFDPAAPLFERLPPEDRLDPNDAHFVDVIHTCNFFVGIGKPIGTVDFYPNGGFNQPGCSKADLQCHHNMSHRFFSRTVKTGKDYMAVKCETLKDAENGTCHGETAAMGIGATAAKPGIYYVKIAEFNDSCYHCD